MWLAVKVFGYILCGASIFLMRYGIYGLILSADKNGNLRFNKKTLLSIACLLSLFIGIAMLSFARHMHQKEQAQNLKIVQKCGQVLSYYPKNNKEILTRETNHNRSGSSETRYTMSLQLEENKIYIYALPDNFQKIPEGKQACFEVQDGSDTQGAYQSEILRTLSLFR